MEVVSPTLCVTVQLVEHSLQNPPSNANCDISGITGTSTTLNPLSRGTTYYIWVAAVSSGGQGPYTVTGNRTLLTMVKVNNNNMMF